jgi:glycosyltransferase involved in cell wall biosynthesis
LESVFTQSGNFCLEVIVVDDGSSDFSLKIAKEYNHKIDLYSQTNQGPATARNRGIEAATGKYLAFLDADDYWLPDFLNETVTFLENNLEAVAVSVGQLHKIPGKPDTVAPAILKNNPDKYSKSVLLENFFEFWAEHNHVCTGSVLMRTETVKLTGGQRPELRITEDLEFWAYLATYGKWGFIPEVLFVSDGGIVTKKQGWVEKNTIRWNSAPSVEEWEKRITDRMNGLLSEGFKRARGRIAGNLAYSMILSSRFALARDTVRQYSKDLRKNKMNLLLIMASKNSLIWKAVCKLLRKREYKR